MSLLSDSIEEFIIQLLQENGATHLKRNELAQRFSCAPSQINYVLTTRFSPNRGYSTQSRRGGGGYIRIVRINADRANYVAALIDSEIGESINIRRAAELIEGLHHMGFLEANVKEIILAAISNKALKGVVEGQNELRAQILKEILYKVI